MGVDAFKGAKTLPLLAESVNHRLEGRRHLDLRGEMDIVQRAPKGAAARVDDGRLHGGVRVGVGQGLAVQRADVLVLRSIVSGLAAVGLRVKVATPFMWDEVGAGGVLHRCDSGGDRGDVFAKGGKGLC
jgi:hypothetical protein